MNSLIWGLGWKLPQLSIDTDESKKKNLNDPNSNPIHMALAFNKNKYNSSLSAPLFPYI